MNGFAIALALTHALALALAEPRQCSAEALRLARAKSRATNDGCDASPGIRWQDSRSQIKPPLSTPAGVERGRGGIGGEYKSNILK